VEQTTVDPSPAPDPCAPSPDEPDEAVIDEALEARLEVAYQRGLEEGRSQATAEAVEAAAEAQLDHTALDDALQALANARADALRQSADDVAQIVIALANRVVGESLALHPDALPGIVRQALARLPDGEEVWIDVRPEDIERLSKFLPESRHVHLVPKPLTGGCVVRTRYASLESTLEAVMEGVEAAVTAWANEQ